MCNNCKCGGELIYTVLIALVQQPHFVYPSIPDAGGGGLPTAVKKKRQVWATNGGESLIKVFAKLAHTLHIALQNFCMSNCIYLAVKKSFFSQQRLLGGTLRKL
jgi:hypothetical protein